MKKIHYFIIAVTVIVLDQSVKLAVYSFMELGPYGEIKLLGDLFKLHYTLNPGMAFGIELGSAYGKLLLTCFRLVAVGAIVWYIFDLHKQGAPKGLIICISMILGGAVGNLVDSIFYGVWLQNAPYEAPSPWLHGQVIDMFYIDIWEGFLPAWIPFIGGQYYAFWPIFNIADASIFIAVCIILIYQKRFFGVAEKSNPVS